MLCDIHAHPSHRAPMRLQDHPRAPKDPEARLRSYTHNAMVCSGLQDLTWDSPRSRRDAPQIHPRVSGGAPRRLRGESQARSCKPLQTITCCV